MVMTVAISHGSGQTAPAPSERKREVPPMPGPSRLFTRAVNSGFTSPPEDSAASTRAIPASVPAQGPATADDAIDRVSASSKRLQAADAQRLDRRRDELAKADACGQLACSGVEDMQARTYLALALSYQYCALLVLRVCAWTYYGTRCMQPRAHVAEGLLNNLHACV